MVSGVGSGLDVASIVNQLMQVERAPAARFNALRLAALSRATAWGDIGSKLNALRTAAEGLATPQKAGPAKATSSDSAVLTATAADGARPASLRLSVKSLAVAQQLSSGPLAGPTSLAGAGTAFLSTGLSPAGIAGLSADATATAGKHSVAVTQASSAATKTGSAVPTLDSTLGVTPRSLTIGTEASSRTVDLATTYASADALVADLKTKLAGVVDVSLDGGRVRFSSLAEGSATQIDVSGTATTDLGMDSPTSVNGTDALVSLDGGTATAVSLVQAGTTVALGSGISLTAAGGLRVATATSQLVRTTETSTLADLTSALNLPGGPAAASLVNTGDGSATPYRLVVSSAATGKAGALSISSSGIAALSPTGMTVTTEAADAELTLGGLKVTRSTNSISDLVPDVTLRLLKLGDATVDVVRDDAALAGRAKALVDGLNGLLTSISTQTKPGSNGAKGGPIAGNGAARSLASQFQSLSSQAVGSATTRVLSQVGISVTRAGLFSLDEAALAKAVQQDPEGVGTLLSSFSGLVGKAAKAATGTDGVVTTSSTTANDQAKARQKQIDDLDLRLQTVERRYRTQFAKLDSVMSVLNSQAGRLASQIAGLGS